jgi:hypothetical protein
MGGRIDAATAAIESGSSIVRRIAAFRPSREGLDIIQVCRRF